MTESCPKMCRSYPKRSGQPGAQKRVVEKKQMRLVVSVAWDSLGASRDLSARPQDSRLPLLRSCWWAQELARLGTCQGLPEALGRQHEAMSLGFETRVGSGSRPVCREEVSGPEQPGAQ